MRGLPKWRILKAAIAATTAIAISSCSEDAEPAMGEPETIPEQALLEFIESVRSDPIPHLGRYGEVTGTFNKIEFEGVAELAGSDYQIVLDAPEGRALVAILPDSFTPELGKRYCLTGTLAAVGAHVSMAGIEVEKIEEVSVAD